MYVAVHLAIDFERTAVRRLGLRTMCGMMLRVSERCQRLGKDYVAHLAIQFAIHEQRKYCDSFVVLTALRQHATQI